MDPGLLLVPLGALIGFSIAYIVTRRRAAAWRYAARRAGLTGIREKRRLWFLTELRGEIDGFTVVIQAYRHAGKNKGGTKLIVSDNRGRIPVSLDLRAESIGTAIEKTFGAKEIELGDREFDDQVYVRGAEETLLAVLDEQTRALVRQTVGRGARIVDGGLRWETRGNPDGESLAAVLEMLLAMARQLARPVDVVERLVERVRHDSAVGVRLHCLDLLARKFAGDERARAAFREQLGSEVGEMRLRAAMALGEDGEATLLEIASGPQAEETPAARALAALGASLPVDRALAILETALAAGRRVVARATVEALAAVRSAAAVPPLVRLLAASDAAGDGELAVATARSLAAIGDSSAEAGLAASLASVNAELRLAAADALGRLGTAAAVAPLHAAVDDHLLDLDLRSAARQAVASIQSRAAGASPGQVSLAEGESGQVSVAEDRGGRVTLPEAE